MSQSSFVGFQESIDIPEGFQPFHFEDEVLSTLDRDSLFLFFSTPEKISLWFYPCIKIDSRPGGKVLFCAEDANNFEARCTSVNLGKEISFLADLFGRFTSKVESIEGGSKASISFSILTNRPDEMKAIYSHFLEKLREIVVR
jgi:hypothetical protein